MRGRYWKLEIIDDDESWTIDNWMFTHDGHRVGAESTHAVASAIASRSGARATILRIKQESVGAEQRVFGRWLYEAVLTAPVETYDEYVTWMDGRDPFERSTGSP